MLLLLGACNWIPVGELQGSRRPEPGATAVDEDGDGFTVEEDCDDSDAAVHPSADEEGGDGIDNDCDGTVDCDDPDLWTSEWEGVWEGDVRASDLASFCDGWCSRTITGSLTLESSGMTDLDDLHCLTAVEGGLVLTRSPVLSSLHGLERLRRIDGAVLLFYNEALLDLDALEGLESADSISLWGLINLGSLSGFRGLSSTSGISIWDCRSLRSLDGLEGFRTLDDLSIRDNLALRDVTALYGLDTVGTVEIDGNTELGDAAAWALVNEIENIEGEVSVSENQ